MLVEETRCQDVLACQAQSVEVAKSCGSELKRLKTESIYTAGMFAVLALDTWLTIATLVVSLS